MYKLIKCIIVATLFISCAFICISTNPNKVQYAYWIKEEYLTSSNSQSGGLTEVFARFVSSSLAKEYTSSKNYVLFTVYNTKFNNETFKVIGVLNHFIPLQKLDQ